MKLIILLLMSSRSVFAGVFQAAPLSQNVTVGTTVSFHCIHETGSVFWRINDQRFEDFPAATTSSVGGVHTLKITGPSLEYNGTKIQCIASVDTVNEFAPPATLLLQGPLDPATDIHISRDTLTISWNPPFSLDLTNVYPDIVYCLEVYNITCGGRELLISDCDVTETSYTSDIFSPDGYIYFYAYTISPRSNVEGTINGTLGQLLKDQIPRLVVHSSQVSMQNSDHVAYKGFFNLNEPYLPLPSSFTLSLDALDGLGDMDSVDTISDRIEDVLTLAVDGLPRHRLCICIVKPYRCQNNSVMVQGDAELSTHDIQNISVTSPQPGEVRVTGDFINGSEATGLLTIVVISTSKIFYHLIERGSDQLHIEGSILGVVGGEHSISFFVVEESGLPFNRTASTPKVMTVENSNDVYQPSIEYSLQSTSTGVCITCTFLDSSATDCVAVVHQRISQLSSSGLMNIESSHKLNRSGDTASGCIEGVNMEDYQVGVVGGIKSDPLISQQDSNDYVGLIVGFVFAVLFVLVSVVLVIVPMVLICKTKGKRRIFHSQSSENSDIELAKNDYVECPLKELAFKSTPQEVSNDERRELPPPPHEQAPPSPQISNRADNELDEPTATEPDTTYATPEIIKKPISAPPLEVTVKYGTVEKFINPQGQEYAMVVLTSPSGQTKPDDLHKTTSEYSQILHGQHPNGVKDTQNKSTGEPKKHLSQCDEGSSHRQTHEEPNLTLELMHKESELTQNEVEPTDTSPAKEPQPKKPPTDSEYHHHIQHEQTRYKSKSTSSDESSDSGFVSGASDEPQSNSSNSFKCEDEDSKGTKTVQPETQNLH